MSQGTLLIFLTRPIAGVITAAAIFFFIMPIVTPWWRRFRGQPPTAEPVVGHG
jgi:TctA family transporter